MSDRDRKFDGAELGWLIGAYRRDEIAFAEFGSGVESWADAALEKISEQAEAISKRDHQISQMEQSRGFAPDCEQVWNSLMGDKTKWGTAELLEAKVNFALNMTALGIRPARKPDGLDGV